MKRYASYDYESSNEDNIKTTQPTPSSQTTQTTTTTSNASSNNSNNQVTTIAKRMLSCSNKIGNYIIGPKLNGFNYGSLTPYLCRKDNSKDFFILKILNSDKDFEKETLHSRMLLHNEYTLLTLLKDESGIIKQHGLFREINRINGEIESSEKLCLVLDCYLRHEYDNKHYFTNLQHYIIKQKYLNERESLALLYKIFKIVETIHNKNIVHRDLKLGNIVYDLNSQRVYLINFCLGYHLRDENELLNEQFGSPAYISPDCLSNMPYMGKPNDIWSLGIVFYTMLFGHLPFYDPIPDRLFKKIQSAEFLIPNNIRISDSTKVLIRNILEINPIKRFTATQVLDSIMSILATHLCKSLTLIDTRKNVNQSNSSSNKRCKNDNDDDLTKSLNNLSTKE